MDKNKNPFKVPENYFEELKQQLNVEAKKKHRFVPTMFRYVATIGLFLTLSATALLIFFNKDRQEPLLSSNIFSIFIPNKNKVENNTKTNIVQQSEILWEKEVNELIAEAEQIQFTEEELDYLENFIDEDFNEYVFNHFENIE
jgi:hypothetical protein